MTALADDRRGASSSVATARLHAVLLCDLADSTALIERLGDAAAAELTRNHDRIARDRLHRHGGREIDKTDGFLMLFERPIQAVAFALDYQHALRGLARQTGQPLRSRVGIHVGEVLLWNNAATDIADGAKPVEVEGLAKAIAARMMSLARPGQILLSETAFGLAQRARHELGSRGERLRWLNHGRYRLKGMDVPLPVFEVGEAGAAPLQPPPSGAKAKRLLPWWRTRWAQAALLLIALSIPLVMLMRPQPAIAFAERDWVVVSSVRNLTSSRAFDGALDVAFRIGLEQSRHVNILSTIAVNGALRRMQYAADTVVDRDIGSEIAQREGARAVIVPTIAEVGGRLRFTAEVVDPVSRVTVYSESADGSVETGALDALDDVLASLRIRLGESIASVERGSQPLAKVTTGNIEALRAYSLALQSKSQGRFADARAFSEQAAELDPGFALARIHLASLALIERDHRRFEQEVQAALRLKDRVTLRERLLLEATAALLDQPASEVLARWRRLAEMFPDDFRGHINHAHFAHHDANDYRAGLDLLGPALSRFNGRRREAFASKGILLLAIGEFEQSIDAFRQAEGLGLRYKTRVHAEAFAAQGRLTEAKAVMQTATESGLPAVDLELRLTEITFAIESGDWPAALAAASAIADDALRSGPAAAMTFDGLPLLLQSYQPSPAHREALQAYIDGRLAMLGGAAALDRRLLEFQILAAGWAAAHAGHVELARKALGVDEGAHPLPSMRSMRAVLRAELALAGGDANAAIERLRDVIDGTELTLVHALNLRALHAAGRRAEAEAEARWLLDNRGRAYAEFGGAYLTQAASVLETRLAGRVIAAPDVAGDADWDRGMQPVIERRQALSPSGIASR